MASLATALLGLLLTVGVAVGQTASDFEDVPSGHIAETAIKWAASNSITAGVGNNRFGMGQTLTRYEMVTFLCRAFDPGACTTGSRGSDRFVDVPADHWANFSIGWAVEEGITSGTSATEFGGGGTLAREEMVTFLYRAKGSPTGGPAGSDVFNDVPVDPGHWAGTPIGWAYQQGVTGGISAGVFGFGSSLSREEMVLFLCRAVTPDICPPSQSPIRSGVITVTTSTTTTAPTQRTRCEFPDHAFRVSEAVYQVHTTDGIGTAFYIGNDEWLTAAHVVRGESSVTLRREGVSLNATIVGMNIAADLAMLRAPGGGVGALRFGLLSTMVPGHWVFSVGYPVYVASQPSVTRGILSRTEVDAALGNLVVTDAANNPGNSGGPLLNECGEVIGLVVQKVVGEGVEGISYAVAESTLRQRLPGLRLGQSGADSSEAKGDIDEWVYFSGETDDGKYEGYRLGAAGHDGYTWERSPTLYLTCGISNPHLDRLFIATDWLIFGEWESQEVLIGYSHDIMDDPEIEWWWSNEDSESAVFAEDSSTQVASWMRRAATGSLVMVIWDRFDNQHSMWFEIDGAVEVLDELDCW